MTDNKIIGETKIGGKIHILTVETAPPSPELTAIISGEESEAPGYYETKITGWESDEVPQPYDSADAARKGHDIWVQKVLDDIKPPPAAPEKGKETKPE